jgi:hypothetical protein
MTTSSSNDGSDTNKAEKLKVFGGLLFIKDKQYRHFIAVPTLAALERHLMALPYGGREIASSIKSNWTETHHPLETEQALANPGAFFRYDQPGYSDDHSVVLVKAEKLKVFGGLIFIKGKQYRHFIAVPTLAALGRHVMTLPYGGRVSASYIKSNWSETRNPFEMEQALANPGAFFRYDKPGYSADRSAVLVNLEAPLNETSIAAADHQVTSSESSKTNVSESTTTPQSENQPVLAQRLLDALTHAVEIAEAKRDGRWDDLLAYRGLIEEAKQILPAQKIPRSRRP